MTLVPKGDRSGQRGGLAVGDNRTLACLLVRCQVPERAVRTALIVIDAPLVDLGLRIRDRRELVDVQALIAEPAVERLDEGISTGLPGRMKSSCTPRANAESSSALDMNSVPWSTVIDRGGAPSAMARSRTTLTLLPDMLEAASRIGLWRLH